MPAPPPVNIFPDLFNINKLIRANSIVTARTDFAAYINRLKGLGSYNDRWVETWISEVYTLGEIISGNSKDFIDLINTELESTPDPAEREPLIFLKSVIALNNNRSSAYDEFLNNLSQVNPQNPQLLNVVGEYHYSDRRIEEARRMFIAALTINSSHSRIVENRFKSDVNIIKEYIKNDQLEEGKKFLMEILRERFYVSKSSIYHNALIVYLDRIEDRISLTNVLGDLKEEIQEKYQAEFKEGYQRLIQSVALITAVIAFFLGSGSIALNFNFEEASRLIIIIAAVMLLLLISIFQLTSQDKSRYGNRFLFALSLVLILILLLR